MIPFTFLAKRTLHKPPEASPGQVCYTNLPHSTMAGGKVFPTEMVPESTTSELTAHPAVTTQPGTKSTDNDLDSISGASAPVSQKLILPEPERINLQLKRKRSVTPVPTHVLDRRARINGNERTIQDRKLELQNILKAVDDANDAQVPVTKKQKQDQLVVGGALTNTPRPRTRVPREIVVRTEVVPMLPCKGYKLPERNSGNVVYIAGRERVEGLPWMSLLDAYGNYGNEPDDDEFDGFGGDESDEDESDEDESDEGKSNENKSDKDEPEEKFSVVNVVDEGGDH